MLPWAVIVSVSIPWQCTNLEGMYMNRNSLRCGSNQDATQLYIRQALLCNRNQDQGVGSRYCALISLCYKASSWFKSKEDIVKVYYYRSILARYYHLEIHVASHSLVRFFSPSAKLHWIIFCMFYRLIPGSTLFLPYFQCLQIFSLNYFPVLPCAGNIIQGSTSHK